MYKLVLSSEYMKFCYGRVYLLKNRLQSLEFRIITVVKTASRSECLFLRILVGQHQKDPFAKGDV